MRRPSAILRLGGVLLALTASGIAVAADSRAPAAVPMVRAASASGALELTDSRGGRAVISAAAMRPGDVVSGDVDLVSSGGDADATLSATGLRDAAGLSTRLRLTVTDVGLGRVVYSGPMADLGSVALGTLRADERRTFRFAVALPADVDNAYAGSSANVTFEWSAVAATVAATGAHTGAAGSAPPTATGTGNGGYAAPTGIGDIKPPKLRVSAPRSQRVVLGTLMVTAKCSERCSIVGASRGFVRATAPIGKLAPHTKSVVVLRLSRRTAKRIARQVAGGRRIKVRVRLMAADMASNRSSAGVNIKIRR